MEHYPALRSLIYHSKIEDEQTESPALSSLQRPYDGRWFKCKRPFITTGGELTLDMLDLSFNATPRSTMRPSNSRPTTEFT